MEAVNHQNSKGDTKGICSNPEKRRPLTYRGGAWLPLCLEEDTPCVGKGGSSGKGEKKVRFRLFVFVG